MSNSQKEKLPSPTWWEDKFLPYRGMMGIYMFFLNGKCLYVGRAKCIYTRVLKHKKRLLDYDAFQTFDAKSHIVGMDYFNADAFVKLMEAYFIELLKPMLNVQKRRFMPMLYSMVETIPAVDKVIEITECEKRFWPITNA